MNYVRQMEVCTCADLWIIYDVHHKKTCSVFLYVSAPGGLFCKGQNSRKGQRQPVCLVFSGDKCNQMSEDGFI